MTPDERTRRVLLAGLTVAALVAGAWWWRAAAPAVDRADPGPTGSPAAFLEPGLRVAIDARTGQVLPGPDADPDQRVVIHQAPDGTVRQLDDSQVLWRERSHLLPDGPPVRRQTNASDADRVVLTVGCSGAGSVVVGVSGAPAAEPERTVSCGGAPEVVVLETGNRPLLVWFAALGDEVDLDARLAAVS
ncbi:hypothetical protein ACIBPB_29080 [Micromonospora sp. NPDC049836]|uniref:hypothetical protein n=1 Tax=Micromonospora sp. NPDC049836 TaxID=3364274 RepID=UPI0037BC5014